MILLIAEIENGHGATRQVVGQEAEDDETLTCEGCGNQTAVLLETDDSVMLCYPCMKSCCEEAV